MSKRLTVQAENLLRALRCDSRLWLDETTKIDRVLRRAKQRMMRRRAISDAMEPRTIGRYSGLTRRELAQSGTRETDWY